MKPALALAIVALSLAGCQSSATPVPVDRFYRISIAAPVPIAAPQLPGTVLVARLDADGLMRERPVVYSADADGNALTQHEYDFWIEPPTRLLQAELVRYLRAAGVAQSIVTPELRVTSEFEVIGSIRRFERLIGRSAPRVAVSLELALVDRSGDQPRVVQTYAAEIACADDTVDGSVTAFNQAISAIFAEFLRDIRTSGAAT